MANSHVGHDCMVGDDVTFANSVALGGHVEIGDGVIFGGLAAVQQFCRVGKGAMVGGLTGVNRDVIPYAMAFGDHVELAGLNLIGLKRRGLSARHHQRHAGDLPLGVLRRGRRHGRPRPRRARRNMPAWRKWPRSRISSWPTPSRSSAWRAGAGTDAQLRDAWASSRAAASCRAPWRKPSSAAGRDVFVVPLVGSVTEDWIKPFHHEFLSPGEPGRIIKALKARGVQEVLLAGRVDRPKFSEMKLDAKGMLLLPKAIAAAKKGDDALLRFIVGICEDEGLTAISVAQAAPALVARAGAAGRACARRRTPRRHQPRLSRSSMRWGRWMWARRRWCAKGCRWRWKRPRAPTPCWRASATCAKACAARRTRSAACWSRR